MTRVPVAAEVLRVPVLVAANSRAPAAAEEYSPREAAMNLRESDSPSASRPMDLNQNEICRHRCAHFSPPAEESDDLEPPYSPVGEAVCLGLQIWPWEAADAGSAPQSHWK